VLTRTTMVQLAQCLINAHVFLLPPCSAAARLNHCLGDGKVLFEQLVSVAKSADDSAHSPPGPTRNSVHHIGGSHSSSSDGGGGISGGALSAAKAALAWLVSALMVACGVAKVLTIVPLPGDARCCLTVNEHQLQAGKRVAVAALPVERLRACRGEG
jgi:hypothetical protein